MRTAALPLLLRDACLQHAVRALVGAQASGVREGRPRNVLSEEVDAFFSTNEGEALLPPW